MKYLIPIVALTLSACGGDFEQDPLDVNFDIPRTETFPQELSAYELFDGAMADLNPSPNTHLYELSSDLFTDYAGKHRLVRVPEGESVSDGPLGPNYPDGTILVKTFYFDADLRDPSQGRQIVETRLLVKKEGLWNVATYLWNEEQTEAFLSLDGSDAAVSWLDSAGQAVSTDHEIPSEVACVTCHQVNGQGTYIGPKYRNLDRPVERGGQIVNQIEYLNGLGLLPSAESDQVALVDYKDTSQSLEDRARSYLEINCAHCHNPDAWERPARKEIDLRYDTPIGQTKISSNIRPLRKQIDSGEMPFIGTTLKHDEGIDLLLDYLDTF